MNHFEKEAVMVMTSPWTRIARVFLLGLLMLPGCREDVQLLAGDDPDSADAECRVCTADDTCTPVLDGTACAVGACLEGMCVATADGCDSSLRFGDIAAGARHTCGASLSGLLLCWGDNSDGQLGVGDIAPRLEPTAVAGGLESYPWERVIAGSQHTCAQQADNTGWCWGKNDKGQLGVGHTDVERSPALIAGDIAWSMLTAGDDHTCGISISRELWCWGSNENGAIGVDGTEERYDTPQHVLIPDVEWRAVAAGEQYTCAIDWQGDLWCWGQSEHGALGLGDIEQRDTPTRVEHAQPWLDVAAGERDTCAMDDTGGLYCWGENERGETGTGSGESEIASPTSVSGSTRFEYVALGAQHACGVAEDGSLRCWGDNEASQLGLDGLVNSAAPVQVGTAYDWSRATAGQEHTCATRSNGALFCWGDNEHGQLGLMDTTPRIQPFAVCPLTLVD